MIRVIGVVLIACCVLADRGQAQVRRRPPGVPPSGVALERLRIGLDPNPKAGSQYDRRSWAESIALMHTTGANHYHYAKYWAELERNPGIYDLDEVRFIVANSAHLPMAFNLRVVDAGARNMPEAYKSLAWDSPAMIGHISNVIRELAPALGTRPWSYAIGNEVNIYLSRHPEEIAAYGRMLQAIKPVVKGLHPEASYSTCLESLVAGQLSTLYAPLVPALDHVTFTYYPLTADFAVRGPNALAADLPGLLAAAAPRAVLLQELGYPTSALLGSSPEQQRAFIENAFTTLRGVGTSKVLGATVLFQADLPNWLVDDIARQYGAANSDRFKAFIQTLGVRDEKDVAKPAWEEFTRQAALIGPPR